MLYEVTCAFETFLKDRNWDYVHHPKESSFNLTVEYLELLELFEGLSLEKSNTVLKDPALGKAICSEIGDICNCFGILGLKLEINIQQLENEITVTDSAEDALTLLLRLGSKIKSLLECFEWLSEESSRKHGMHPLSRVAYRDALDVFLDFCQKLEVHPFEIALSKMSKTCEKYPENLNLKLVENHLNIKTRKRLDMFDDK